jgi:transcriptional regulator with XRE-family HTH domain
MNLYISGERLRWIKDGERLKAARNARDLSLREAARVLNVSAADLSAAEWGRADPTQPINYLAALHLATMTIDEIRSEAVCALKRPGE